jgi:Tfp pilus assembly protein PilF
MTQVQSRAGSNTHTYFFREPEALDFVRKRVAARGRAARVWCVGCSTGDETYSLGIALDGLRAEIVGSDIRDDALVTATAGTYHVRHLRHMSDAAKDKYFTRRGESVTVTERVRRDVRFVRHHMVEEAPLTPGPDGKWDVIFCRNVLLYYEDDQVATALANLASVLAPDGILVLGATEWAGSALLAKMPQEHLLSASLEDQVVIYRRADAMVGVSQQARKRPITAAVRSAAQVKTAELELMPDTTTDVSELRRRGEQLMDAGDARRAAQTFETALRANPLVADLHARLAFCHLAMGKSAEAEQHLRRSLFLAPTLWPAALVLGDLLMTEDRQAAKRYLLQAWNAVEKGSLDAASAATAQVAPFVCAESAALDAVRVRLAWLKQRESSES